MIFFCNESIHVTDEPYVTAYLTVCQAGKMPFVMESVLVMANVISGVVNRAYSGNWTSFEVVHIFPLESESYWLENNYS
jgi:hypothetical protein